MLPPDESSERERHDRAEARKAKILAASRGRSTTLSDLDREDMAKASAVLSGAKHALDEHLEEVKRINQMISLAKVQATLEEQREEKVRLQKIHDQETAEIEARMEADRVTALALQEQRQRERVEAMRSGAMVVVQQIAEMDKRKLLEKNLKERERLHIQTQLDRERNEQEQEEARMRLERKAHLDEILAANDAALKTKLAIKENEKLEDQRFLEFQQKRQMEAEAREEELTAEAVRREAELAKLRSVHERANDKTAELDALRAKRAMEAAERAARLKETHERERQERINASLVEARRVQHAEKEFNQALHARLEKEEVDKLSLTYKLQCEQERIRKQSELDKLKVHSSELKNQIEAKREKLAQQREDFLEEGNLVRAQLHAEQRRMVEIRKSKLQELIHAGVPEKHCMNIKKALLS